MTKLLKQTIQAYVAENNIKRCFEILLNPQLNIEDDLLNELTVLSARFKKNEKNQRRDIISGDEYGREHAKITNSLLQVVSDLSEDIDLDQEPSRDSVAQQGAAENSDGKAGGRKGELSQSAQDNGADFCQNKLRELLSCEDNEIENKIRSVHRDVITPWLGRNIPEKNSDEIVEEVVGQTTNAFEIEEKEFDKFILAKIKVELGLIKNLEQSWENYSGYTKKIEEIANRLMEGDYSDSLSKIQAWAKAVKSVHSPNEWRAFFNRIQKIAGWFVLKSINQDWWVNNFLSFTEGAKNHGFVRLCIEEKHFSYSEVVVSKALRKSAQFILNNQNKLIPQTKEYAIREGNDFVFDCNSDAALHTLLIPIVTDLRKTKPQIEDANELFNDLLEIASTNTDNFFYLVTESYLKKLQAQSAPDGSGKTVLEVINEKLKDKLFFISIDTENVDGELQVTNNFMQAITLMENILLIDK